MFDHVKRNRAEASGALVALACCDMFCLSVCVSHSGRNFYIALSSLTCCGNSDNTTSDLSHARSRVIASKEELRNLHDREKIQRPDSAVEIDDLCLWATKQKARAASDLSTTYHEMLAVGSMHPAPQRCWTDGLASLEIAPETCRCRNADI